MKVIKNLNKLAEVNENLESLQAKQEEIIRQALLSSPSLEEDYNKTTEEINSLKEQKTHLTEKIISEVLKIQKTVKGEKLQAIYSRGRTSWDNSALNGYATTHPEIIQFRKEGKPSVSIRKNKSSKEE